MALNRVLEDAKTISVPVPDGTVSGDPLVVGGLPCVALIDQQADGNATVDTGGAYRFDVTGGSGGPDAGDIVYLQGDGSIDDDDSGARFGYAMVAVENGQTTEIPVKIGY
jgi:predicted RecA/RadA family phage recombinase